MSLTWEPDTHHKQCQAWLLGQKCLSNKLLMGQGLINSFGKFRSIVQISFSKNQWSTEQWLTMGGYRCQTTWVHTNLAKRLRPPNFTSCITARELSICPREWAPNTLCCSPSRKNRPREGSIFSSVNLCHSIWSTTPFVSDEVVHGVNYCAECKHLDEAECFRLSAKGVRQPS